VKLIRAGLAATAVAAGAATYSRYLSRLAPDLGGEPMTATTSDGWVLSMRRYAASGSGPRRAVVAGHGFAGTSMVWDLMRQYSLARYLAAAGFDFYAVDWRGRGSSWPRSGPSRDLTWSFDDFVFKDLPAVVGAACAASDVDSVQWIGLEMSGQVLYAGAISGTADHVSSAITLGSPVLTPPSAKVPGVTAAPRARRHGRVQFRAGAHHAGPVLALVRSHQLDSSFRIANVDPVVPARYLRHGVPDESGVIADQFRDWVDNATMRSVDHATVWSDRTSEVTIPMLLLAAARDLQRPAEAVRDSLPLLGSRDKTFMQIGTATGYRVDYGHDDLIAARTSPDEVFPLIRDWLSDHTSSAKRDLGADPRPPVQPFHLP
jgi:pimeloyl-ACP methyl ester carboxylesterase